MPFLIGRTNEARGDLDRVRRPRLCGKPRPALILQDDLLAKLASVTVVPLTTHPVKAADIRPPIEPTAENGLRATSRVMIDKISTVRRTKCEGRIGRLSAADLARVNGSAIVFLGLAGRK